MTPKPAGMRCEDCGDELFWMGRGNRRAVCPTCVCDRLDAIPDVEKGAAEEERERICELLLTLGTTVRARVTLAAAVGAIRAGQEVEPPVVCPGCHAVGEEACAPGCIDAEMEQEAKERRASGDTDDENGDAP